MTHDWRKQTATPERLWTLFRDNQLPPAAWRRAHEIIERVPTVGQWLGYIDRLLVASGTIFLVAGIFFFFAFNWADLPKFGRFAILEISVIVTAVLSPILGIDSWGGRVALAASAMLIGATLAVTGQAYQTGADSYQLFLKWTLLISGWVLISRWNIMWALWMILLNVTISMYWWQIIGDDGNILNMILMVLNLGFVLGWDILVKLDRFEFMRKGRWFLYFLMAFIFAHATFLMMDFIFEFDYRYGSLGGLAPFVYVATLGIVGAIYTIMKRDLLMLTIAAFSLLVVGVAGIGRVLYESLFSDIPDPFLFFFLMGIITVTLTGALAIGLRRLQSTWEAGQ